MYTKDTRRLYKEMYEAVLKKLGAAKKKSK